MQVDPLEDGTKHINVHYKAKTPLGRMLSPPYRAAFSVREHGTFQSVGGYWAWLVFDRKDGFRDLSGEDVLVRQNFDVDTGAEDFRKKILHPMWQKIRQNSTIWWRFQQNILPYRRYTLVEDTIYQPSSADWLIDGLSVMEEYTEKYIW